MLRRDALAALGALMGFFACGRPRGVGEPPASTAAPAPLLLDPIVDVVPVAGLVWLLDARPHELFEDPVLGPALSTIIPASRLNRFAERHGGLDMRVAAQLAVASYPGATLVLARLPFRAERVERAFGARVGHVEGRSVERGVTRMWGSVTQSQEELALLAPDGFAFEHGQPGVLRAAVYFAQGRLRRSRPALRAEPLASAASVVGDAPLRVFAPGPFEGEWARGAAGLLGASTAVALAVRPVEGVRRRIVALRVVLMGAWGQDGAAAAQRLRSAFGVLAEDALGQVLGINQPVDGPAVAADADALRLEVLLDAEVLARGIHVSADASVAEIMAY